MSALIPLPGIFCNAAPSCEPVFLDGELPGCPLRSISRAQQPAVTGRKRTLEIGEKDRYNLYEDACSTPLPSGQESEMNADMYERMRAKLFGGHRQNAFAQLLKDRAGITKPIQGSPEEFSQILLELTQGDLNAKNSAVVYEVVAKGKKDILKFKDGSLFRVIRAKSDIQEQVIIAAPHLPSMDDLLYSKEAPLTRLVNDSLMIRDAYKWVVDEYRLEERRLAAEKAVVETRMARESKLTVILETIERTRSGNTVMIRGQQNIDALLDLGFVPCLVDNPDDWIDAEDFPGMRYRHEKSRVELLLTGREKFRPIEEPHRLEFTFLLHRSDDDAAAFERMAQKYRRTRRDGTTYSPEEFRDELIALVKYPEELKGRTEEDLGVMADEVEHAIDRRQNLDKGILPYEALFGRDTRTIIDFIQRNKTPGREIRKALDYFEYTGMIDAQYKEALHRQIAAATARSEQPAPSDLLYDKRVKEIVAEVLKKIPKEKLTPKTVTLALAPYVSELGFGRLVKIRERILQLKDMVHDQDGLDGASL